MPITERHKHPDFETASAEELQAYIDKASASASHVKLGLVGRAIRALQRGRKKKVRIRSLAGGGSKQRCRKGGG